MENFEPQPQFTSPQEAPSADKPKIVITSEQEEILVSARNFAKYLTGRWPQVDSGRNPVIKIDDKGTTVELPELPQEIKTEARLNYYIVGSLAVMLLALAERFTEMDETQIPALAEARTRKIPVATREIFASFGRQVGDLDYVPIDRYEASTVGLKKGGGISFDEVPEEGLKVLRRGVNQIKAMCDPVKAYGAGRIAKVNVEGQDYYVARPDTILAYKVLHLLQSYEKKPEKFNADFGKLLGALRKMYSKEELDQIIQQVLIDYENEMERRHILLNVGKENPPSYERQTPKFIERVLANQQVSPEIRATLEKLREQK